MADRWFIRTNANGVVVHAFSDDFESPQEGDICVNETGGRYCRLSILDDREKYFFMWNGTQLIPRTEMQRYTIEERKTDKIDEIKQRAHDTFNKRWDSMDMAFAISQMNENGQKYQDLILDVTDWRSARKTAIDLVNAATTKEEVNAVKFIVPQR